ncbi:MAG: M15 family metallopeptidase [Cyanobacteria bacterium P01_D01_bin.105]
MKPYQKVPIEECGEALIAIPLKQFAVVTPHPYVALGAPYGHYSPYFLRQGVIQKLLAAQAYLQRDYPTWKLQIFDAYRPISVQQFMVDYTFRQLAIAECLDITTINEDARERLQAKVSKFWAAPSSNPQTPPPHSTGAAIDLTLANEAGNSVDMGSAIDELSPRSYPSHFAAQKGDAAQQFHHHRQILAQAMTRAGFQQHPNEWWHFSIGDQLWAWQIGNEAIARYGNASPP